MKYVGIGNRKLIDNYQLMRQIRWLGFQLACKGYKGVSGSALGPDEAFEHGALDEWESKGRTTEILFESYLPKRYFRGRGTSGYPFDIYHSWEDMKYRDAALEIAKSVHPNWDNVEERYRPLHGRNAFEVLGANLSSPVDIAIVAAEATTSGVRGGTNTAFQLAKRHGIPIYNILSPGIWDELISDLGLPEYN